MNAPPTDTPGSHQIPAHQVFNQPVGEMLDPAEEFHCASKLRRSTALAQLSGLSMLTLSPSLQARTRQAWRRVPSLRTIALPDPLALTGSLGELLARRSSTAEGAEPLTSSRLATLLYAGNGLLDRTRPTASRRTIPSGGGLYSTDIFVCVRNCPEFDQGIYYYHPAIHSLLELARPDAAIDDCFVGLPAGAAAFLILASSFWRSRFKYGLRGVRFSILELGHSAQNILLAATELRIGACPWGGFYEEPLDTLLGLDGLTEGVCYAVVLTGPPAGDSKTHE